MYKRENSNQLQRRLITGLIAVLMLTPVSAFAYLDPTTGSMIISAIVGLFASLVLAIKTYWYRIKGFFKGKPAESSTDDESS